jgi:hypothetical protein
MDADEAEIVVDGLADGCFERSLRLWFGSGNESVPYRPKLRSLAAGFVHRILSGNRDAAALAALAPLDVVRAFGVGLDLAVDADLVFQSAVGFGNGGRKNARRYRLRSS